jgi:DNA-binding winged helix-turn-helix (wHTH) protein
MRPDPQWMFGPFRLDPDNACLWHGAQAVTLKPKSFAVLRYLVAHAGQLVTKEALFKTIWSDVAVGDAVLKVCIGEIRKALGDYREGASVCCHGASSGVSLHRPSEPGHAWRDKPPGIYSWRYIAS